MKDEFDTDMRRALSQAEADTEIDLGFHRDPPPETPLASLMTALTAPGIDMMRALWSPNWRK